MSEKRNTRWWPERLPLKKTAHLIMMTSLVCHAQSFDLCCRSDAVAADADTAIGRLVAARRRIALGAYREAEQSLVEAATHREDSLSLWQHCELMLLRAQVQLDSRRFQPAEDYAEACLKRLAILPAREQDAARFEQATRIEALHVLMSARLARAGTLPKSAPARQRMLASLVSGYLKSALRCASLLGSPRWKIRFRLLGARVADAIPQARPVRQRLWNQLCVDAQWARDLFARSRAPLETYIEATRALARGRAALGEHAEATVLLQDLHTRLGAEHDESKSIRSEMVDLLRRAEQFRNEALTSRRFLQLLPTLIHRARRRPDKFAEAKLLIERASLLRRVARATMDDLASQNRHVNDRDSAAARTEVLAGFRTSLQTYRDAKRVLDRLACERVAETGDHRLELHAWSATCGQGILEASQSIEMVNGAAEITVAEARRHASQLAALLIPLDPRLVRSRVLLAARLVKATDFRSARDELSRAASVDNGRLSAIEFFDRYQPHDMRMRSLARLLRAEIEREIGSTATAADLIEAARRLLGQAPGVEDLRVRLNLCSASLAIAKGKYTLARSALIRIAARASLRAGPELRAYVKSLVEVEAHRSIRRPGIFAAAVLNLATVFRTQLDLDRADLYSRGALQCAKVMGPQDPGRLPYLVCRGECLLAKILRGRRSQLLDGQPAPTGPEDWNELERLIAEAEKICRGSRRGSLGVFEGHILHLKALMHFHTFNGLRAEHGVAGGRANDLKLARHIWQRLADVHEPQSVGWARVNHFLSRSDYLLWTQAASGSGDNRRQRKDVHDYRAQLAVFRKQVAQFKEKMTQFEKDKKILSDAAQIEPKQLEKPRQLLKVRHATLEKFYVELDKKRRTLQATHRALTGLQPGNTAPPKTDRLNTAQDRAKKAYRVLASQDIYPLLRYAALCNLGEISMVLESDKAPEFFRKAVGILDSMRHDMSDDAAVRERFVAHFALAYDRLVEWHVSKNKLEEALVFSERRRNRALLDDAINAVPGKQHGRPAIGQTELIEKSVRAAVARTQNVKEGGVLLYYHLAPTRSYAFLVVAGICTATELDNDNRHSIKVELDEFLKEFERSHQGRYQPRLKAASAKLGKRIIPWKSWKEFKDAGMTTKAEYMLVFPDGGLYGVPFEALSVSPDDSKSYLLNTFPALAYQPSITWHELKRRSRGGSLTEQRLVAVAPPSSSRTETEEGSGEGGHARQDSDPAAGGRKSPWTTKMAAELVRDRWRRGDKQLLEGEQARTMNLGTALKTPTHVLHIGTHMPSSRVGLVFFGRDRLTVAGARSLRLADCELVTLQACGSAQSPQAFRVSMPESHAHAFLVAGARRVIGTLQAVQEESSSELVVGFYKRLSAMPVGSVNYAMALREAKRELMNRTRYKSPFHWAPFILIGPPATLWNDTNPPAVDGR